jgi:hypothetical protein
MMRETRQSGSEGGGAGNRSVYPTRTYIVVRTAPLNRYARFSASIGFASCG